MWWSTHESAVASGVLRAISGSPIYVSDRIGASTVQNIAPTVEDDGTVMLCDYAAVPTLDCVYVDPRIGERIMKVWNRSADAFAVACFNVATCEVTDTVSLDIIPEHADCDYVAYEYFSKKFTRLTADTRIPVTLASDDCAVFSLYPVNSDENGEYIMLGSTEKYVPIASAGKVKTYIDSIL